VAETDASAGSTAQEATGTPGVGRQAREGTGRTGGLRPSSSPAPAARAGGGGPSAATPLLALVDGHSLFHRAFFALPALTSPRGEPTGAVYGFLTMLLRLLQDEAPTHLAVALDRPEPTFRHEAFAAYKAQRPDMPSELRSQVPLLLRALAALRVPTVDWAGAEADDVLGTLATQAAAAGFRVRIVTGDRDALQLVGGPVDVLLTRRGITDMVRMDAAAVRARYGVDPPRMVDVKALMGDPSDNIPGVPTIGEKTACRLISAYGSAEGLLARLDEVGPPRVQAALRAHAEVVRRNLRLCRIRVDLPLPWDPDALRRQEPDAAAARALFADMGSHGLGERLGLGDPAPAAPGWSQTPAGAALVPGGPQGPGPQDGVAAEGVAAAWAVTPLAAAAWTAAVAQWRGAVAVVGEAVPVAPGAAPRGAMRALAALPAAGAEGGGVTTAVLWAGEGDTPVLPELPALLTYDSKPLCHLVLAQGGTWRTPAFDALLAAYVLEPDRAGYPLDDLCRQYGLAVPGADVAARARAVAALRPLMEDAVRQNGLRQVVEEIELPLVVTLAAMERAGVLVDRQALAALEVDFAARITAAEAEIHAAAGEVFNVNSTQQLGRILFERLGLKPPKRTKTGYSTDAEVLEQLALEHPLPALVLRHRTLQKLQSTYVQALAPLIGPDGRVHTTYQQTVAVTGRLASQNPNLQNVPVREEIGRPIRRVFVAPEGWLLVSADYSQVELRILAHLAGDQGLIEAFRSGADIHRRTASEVWGVPLDAVSDSQRSAAKAVNFGIVYGISDFGLARQLGCTPAEAKEIIARYFARYPEVKRYLDGVVEEARQHGVVRTMYGRLRRLTDITSRNWARRSFAERTAMNSPIQGTAADLIKLAMIAAYRDLQRSGLRARLLLQVHDELIFEAPAEERDVVAALALRAMEGAGRLSVPLHAEVQAGPNWLEMTDVAVRREGL
jgi:DNA polymerase-1